MVGHGRDDAQHDPACGREGHRRHRQLHGEGQSARNVRGDRPVGLQRPAEIPPCNVADIDNELLRQRAVQPELAPHGLYLFFWYRGISKEHLHRIPRDEMEHHEHHDEHTGDDER